MSLIIYFEQDDKYKIGEKMILVKGEQSMVLTADEVTEVERAIEQNEEEFRQRLRNLDEIMRPKKEKEKQKPIQEEDYKWVN